MSSRKIGKHDADRTRDLSKFKTVETTAEKLDQDLSLSLSPCSNFQIANVSKESREKHATREIDKSWRAVLN